MSQAHFKRNALIASLAGCFALTGLAIAQSQPTTPAQTAGSNPPSQMSNMAPSKSDTAVSAFQKLDTAKAGYVTKEQAARIEGFDFTQADKNKDGKLDRDEFNAAWGVYSGKPQS
jgi:EF hand domain-containing protein